MNELTELTEHRRSGDALEAIGVGYAWLDRDWCIRWVNATAERLTSTHDHELLGLDHWAAFPAMKGTDFERSYRRAARTGRTVVFESHYPAPLDIWVEVHAVPGGDGLRVYFSDVTTRRTAQQTHDVAVRQLADLAATALAMVAADDPAELVGVLGEKGLSALGCDGAALSVLDPDDPGVLLTWCTPATGSAVQAGLARLDVGSPIALARVAATGRRVLLPDLAACAGFSAATAEVARASGTQALAYIPLRGGGGQMIGVLTAAWVDPQTFDAVRLELLEAFAAQCAQALQRIAAHQGELAATRRAQRTAAEQASLVGLARALGEVDSRDDVLAVVAAQAASTLGANDCRLALDQAGGAPGDPLPAGSVALRAQGRLLGSLALGFATARRWPADDVALLEAFAALTAQAVDRLAARDAERAASRAVASFSETLQRSLLTEPPQLEDLQIVVRYLPAAEQAQVGGDWYDAYADAAGRPTVVIGDVTGHDQRAAAVMGQMRNLLRGIDHVLDGSPAQVLSALDHACAAFGLSTMATAVMARIEPDPDQPAGGRRVLRWSSAGHLPPLLLTADGQVEVLDQQPDLLLGPAPEMARHDHLTALPASSTLLLYTDGLVERRGASLQAGLHWLAETVTELAHLPAPQLCDELLRRAGPHAADDVALLAVRSHP